jgi:hypothetical protein
MAHVTAFGVIPESSGTDRNNIFYKLVLLKLRHANGEQHSLDFRMSIQQYSLTKNIITAKHFSTKSTDPSTKQNKYLTN